MPTRLLVAVAVSLSLLAGSLSAAASGGVTLSAIAIEGDKVMLRLDGLAAYSTEVSPLQKNLIVDLPQVAVTGLLKAASAGGLVKSARARSYRLNGAPMAHVVIRLNGSPAYKIARTGNDIEIAFLGDKK